MNASADSGVKASPRRQSIDLIRLGCGGGRTCARLAAQDPRVTVLERMEHMCVRLVVVPCGKVKGLTWPDTLRPRGNGISALSAAVTEP